MDVAQITELRTWASRLGERATSDELRAAAKAIVMLVAEVEDLQARLVVAEAGAPPPASEEPPPVTEAPAARPQASLVSRLKRSLGFE